MRQQKPHKIIRAVVECRVPQGISEKRLVWCLKQILKWPLQLGFKGDHETLVRTEIKSFSKVQQAEAIKEKKRLKHEWGLDERSR